MPKPIFEIPKTYIGIDNGVSGTISFIKMNVTRIYKMPTFTDLGYQKVKAKNINRIDTNKLFELFDEMNILASNTFALLERPMINAFRFQASISAARAMEATLIVLETLKIPFRYIDSKEWQRELLPNPTQKTVKGKKVSKENDLKQIGIKVANRMFPHVEIPKNCDADALLIAYYAKLKNL